MYCKINSWCGPSIFKTYIFKALKCVIQILYSLKEYLSVVHNVKLLTTPSLECEVERHNRRECVCDDEYEAVML